MKNPEKVEKAQRASAYIESLLNGGLTDADLRTVVAWLLSRKWEEYQDVIAAGSDEEHPEYTTFGVMIDPNKKDMYIVYATSPDGTVEVLDGPSDDRFWFEDRAELYAEYRNEEVRGKAAGWSRFPSFDEYVEDHKNESVF